ncbi:MAG: thiamine-binding protein [Bacteroidota bacterium]
MSVISEIAIFPLGHEHGLGTYVSRVVSMIESSGYDYSLTAMGTIVETDTLAEALRIIESAYDILKPDANRVYCTAKFDISKNGTKRMGQKVASASKQL